MPLEFLAWNSRPFDFLRITAMVILINIIIIIIIIIIIKCRGIYRTPTTTNTELLVILQNDRKSLSIIKKSSLKMLRGLYIRLLNGLFIT